MHLSRRPGSEPLFRQIAEGIRARIADGSLPLGSRLPTVRALAAEYGVARQTVVEAYRLLADWELVEAHVGRDTRVVCELPAPEAKSRLADLLETGPIADFEALSAAAGMRSLATAVPDPRLFHSDELFAEVRRLHGTSPWLFYYAPPAGVPELRQSVSALLRQDGIESDGSDVLVTLGATHALGLIVDELCRPGDEVLVEEPGFLGLPGFFARRGVRVRFFPREGDLPEPGDARAMLVWPSFGPATGTVGDLDRRHACLAYAERHGVYLIEDAHYRRVAFAPVPPPLRALAASPQVIHLDSLSGCLAPGLRTGWIAADPGVVRRLEGRVRDGGQAGAPLLQTAVARYLSQGRLQAHLERTVPRYRSRRDALLSALRFEWPETCRWAEPNGGFSAWLTLPKSGRYDGLYEEALGQGVPFALGPLFGMPPDTLRLSFGTLRPEAVLEAASMLGRIVARRTLGRPS